MTKFGKIATLGIIIAVLAVGGFSVWFFNPDRKIRNEIAETVAKQEVQKAEATEALRSLVDVANELSSWKFSPNLNFEITDMDGRSGNFGIVKYDGVRGERIVEEHIVQFEEIVGASRGNAEVDLATNKVIAMHRSTPAGFAGEPIDEPEKIARQFVERVYPDFVRIESTLEFSLIGKGETNLFFRWDDKRFALPKGLEMDLNPFIQVGITSSGIIFSYDNTVQLYSNLSKEALRAICAFVEMPRTDDSSLDPEKSTVTVWFTEYDPFQNRYLVLPYEPETDFAGCSESAKEWLRHLPNPDKEASNAPDYGFVVPEGWYAHRTAGIDGWIIVLTKTSELPRISFPIYPHVSFSEMETSLAPEAFVDAWGRLGAKSLAEFSGWDVLKEFPVYRILFTKENDGSHMTALFIPRQSGWTVALFTLTPYEAGSERTQTYESIIEQYAERMRLKQKKLDAINANGT